MRKLNKLALVSMALLGGICVSMTGCSWFGGNKNVAPKANIASLQDVGGQEVLLCDKTVSPYVLFRALQKNTNLKVPRDVKIMHVDDDKIASAFLGNSNAKVAVTWNPMVLEVLAKDKSARKIFDSSEIPGEIQDLCVLNTKSLNENPDFARALNGAWYETLNLMQKGGPESEKALKAMASMSGPDTSLEDYKAQLKTTAMYWSAQSAVTFTESKELQAKNELVRQFCFAYGLMPEKAKSADVVGIQYPDGTVQGNRNNVKFRYSSQFMQEYADGKVTLDGTSRSGAARKKFTLAISVYAGWMPWYYAQESGILKKWADRYGIEIEVVRASYPATITLFTGAQCDACVLTNMDTFFNPAAAGIDCTAVIMGDYSNGNDAVIVR